MAVFVLHPGGAAARSGSAAIVGQRIQGQFGVAFEPAQFVPRSLLTSPAGSEDVVGRATIFRALKLDCDATELLDQFAAAKEILRRPFLTLGLASGRAMMRCAYRIHQSGQVCVDAGQVATLVQCVDRGVALRAERNEIGERLGAHPTVGAVVKREGGRG